MLTLVAGSLTAGYSLAQAFDAAVREGNQPMAAELSRALVESRLGIDLEDALEQVAVRMDSRDFAWLVMSIRIQREVGGNLSRVLATVAETLRDRERIRRQVQVLSAEGRLSAAILGALPVVFGAVPAAAAPRLRPPALHRPDRRAAARGAAASPWSIGIVWLRKVVKVEV